MGFGERVVLLSVIIAGITVVVNIAGVYFNVIFNTRHARRRATLEFISRYNEAPGVSRGHKVIREYNGESPAEYLKESGEDFLFLMNMFETLAIGLDSGIYDEKMVMDALGEELRDICGKAEPLIRYIRKKYGGSAFLHIESLASKIKTRR